MKTFWAYLRGILAWTGVVALIVWTWPWPWLVLSWTGRALWRITEGMAD